MARRDLEAELGVRVDLRTAERKVARPGRELEAGARATVRFEAPPGRQMQIDFGHCRMALPDKGQARVRRARSHADPKRQRFNRSVIWGLMLHQYHHYCRVIAVTARRRCYCR